MHRPTQRRLLTVLLLLAAGCVTTPAGDPLDITSSSPPDWTGQPLSWDKLDLIESWLEGDGPWSWPEQVTEAELQLAEGRLALARREAEGLPAVTLSARVQAAEAGFQRVLAASDVSPIQERRAASGIAAIATLRRAPEPRRQPTAGLDLKKRASWGATSPATSRLKRNRTRWSRITIHHSAMSSSSLGGASVAATADAIRRIQLVHMRDEGYGDIGYHFLIDPAGRIYQGRSMVYQGAHAGGSDNVGNVGICLLGDFDSAQPDPRALHSLEKLVDALARKHGIAARSIKGHRQYKATACPGRNLMVWVSRYSTTGHGL